MRKRKSALFLKSSMFMITFCIMILLITNKSSSEGATQLPFSAAKENIPEIIPFQGISQEGIPTGCESVSTVAVLQHLGVNITADNFINEFLPCEKFYRKNGMVYGADPHEAFAGVPYENASLGCYPNVILKALNKMKQAGYPGMSNLLFRNVSGTDLETLLSQYTDHQIPVIFWVTNHMKPSYDGTQYYLDDGSLYTWTAPEHCVVLCGYDENSCYIMDPLENGDIIFYPRPLVEQRYQELGKYALVILSDSP